MDIEIFDEIDLPLLKAPKINEIIAYSLIFIAISGYAWTLTYWWETFLVPIFNHKQLDLPSFGGLKPSIKIYYYIHQAVQQNNWEINKCVSNGIKIQLKLL
jgi:hypothetical protein